MHNVPPTLDTKTDIGHVTDLICCSNVLVCVWCEADAPDGSRPVCVCVCVCGECWCSVCTYRHITFSAGVAFSCKSERYIFDLKFYCKRSVYFSLKLCHLSSCLQHIFYCCQVDSLLLLCFIGSYKSYEWMCITFSIWSVFNGQQDEWQTDQRFVCHRNMCHTFTEVPLRDFLLFRVWTICSKGLWINIYINVVLSQHSQVFLYSFHLYISNLFYVCEFHVCLIK